MPNWNEILDEIQQNSAPFDTVRRRYLRKLHERTKRNIISYYSGWLAKPGANFTSISDLDMEGFMNAMKGLDYSKGLDLLLHTPGGDIAATEAIVKYLRSKFDVDIRVIVPQLAMSAGTMIACSGKEIVMGNQSSLGPIDPQIPQINGYVPAFNIMREYKEAKADLSEHPENAHYWSVRLQGLSPAIIQHCENAITLSSELTKNWLKTGMFNKFIKDGGFIDTLVDENLNENSASKIHGRHFDKAHCIRIGLNIISLEDDDCFQDDVLSVHHAYALTLSNTPASKIIENHNGAACIRSI